MTKTDTLHWVTDTATKKPEPLDTIGLAKKTTTERKVNEYNKAWKVAANEEHQSKVFFLSNASIREVDWKTLVDWLRLNQISRKTTGATRNWGVDPSIPSKISANSMLSQSKTADKGNLFLLICKETPKCYYHDIGYECSTNINGSTFVMMVAPSFEHLLMVPVLFSPDYWSRRWCSDLCWWSLWSLPSSFQPRFATGTPFPLI